MANISTVEAYIEALEPVRQQTLQAVRSLILDAVSGAQETFRYRMLTYEVGGKVLCALASHKRYLSLYMEPAIVEKHAAELADLSVGKSCIRFKRLEDLPLATVRAMLDETVRQGNGL